MRARPVAHGDLGESGVGPLELAHHLHADDAGRRGQLDPLQQGRPDEPEVAVGVADVEVEEQLDRVVVGAADQLAVPRVAPADLPSLHHVDVVASSVDAAHDLGGVVLRIAVGVEDPLHRGRCESGDQRAAVASVRVVTHEPELGDLLDQRFEHGDRAVTGAVVDHDDLELLDSVDQGGTHARTMIGIACSSL